MRDEGLFGARTPRTKNLKRRRTEPITVEEKQVAVRESQALPKKKILFFGDSNMFGQSHIADPTFTNDIRYKHRYPLFFTEKYEVVEAALCSRTTSVQNAYDPEWIGASRTQNGIFDGSSTLPFMLEIHEPQIVVLSLGTNDTRANNRLLSLLENEESVVRFLKRANLDTEELYSNWQTRSDFVTNVAPEFASDYKQDFEQLNENIDFEKWFPQWFKRTFHREFDIVDKIISTEEVNHVAFWSTRIANKALQLAKIASDCNGVKQVYVLSPPTIKLVEQAGGTKSMKYDELSKRICDDFERAFAKIVTGDKITVISLSHIVQEKGVGNDGVHITENANIAIGTALSRSLSNIMPTIQTSQFTTATSTTIPEILCYGTGTELLPEIQEKFRSDVTPDPFTTTMRFVTHVKNFTSPNWETQFHSIFSQHSARWLFLLFDDVDLSLRLLVQAICMVNEHPRHRHVTSSYNTETDPSNIREGLRICLCMKDNNVDDLFFTTLQSLLSEVNDEMCGTFTVTQIEPYCCVKYQSSLQRQNVLLFHEIHFRLQNVPTSGKRLKVLVTPRS